MPYNRSWFDDGLPCGKFEDGARETPNYCYSHFAPGEEQLKSVVKSDRFKINITPMRSVTSIMSSIAAGNPVTVSIPVNQNGWDGLTGLAVHNQELEDQCDENINGSLLGPPEHTAQDTQAIRDNEPYGQ